MKGITMTVGRLEWINSASCREQFAVDETPYGWLVTPLPTKYTWAMAERGYRSVVVNAEGDIVSAGFPKFFNLGEAPDMDARFHAALAAGRVRYTEKLDGSLLIVSLHQGRLWVRTRGTVEPVGAHAEILPWVHQQIQNWPRIGSSHRSLLLEYTGPSNRIVVPYTEPKLTILGVAIHDDPENPIVPVGTGAAFLDDIAGVLALPVVDAVQVDTHLEVDGWRNREGVVALWQDDEGVGLMKIKSDWYLRLHRVLSGHPKSLVELVAKQNLRTIEEVGSRLELDYEMVSHIEPLVQPVFNAQIFATLALQKLATLLLALDPATSRKDVVMHLQANGVVGSEFHAAMRLLDGRHESARAILVGNALDIPARLLEEAWRAGE
jgi:hypothetical protein